MLSVFNAKNTKMEIGKGIVINIPVYCQDRCYVVFVGNRQWYQNLILKTTGWSNIYKNITSQKVVHFIWLSSKVLVVLDRKQ